MENETFFSINGRLRRRDYLVRALLLAIPAAFMNLIIEAATDPGVLVFAALVVIACSVLMVIQAVKRLHDINLSGWFWLVFVVPFVNLIFSIYVLFKDGTPGENAFGVDPKGRG